MIKSDQPSKKPLVYYALLAGLVLLLLNALVFPALLQRQVENVDYSDFLKMIDAGKVKEVALEQDSEQIVFVAEGENGREITCKTGVFPDDDLRQRLEDAGVKFDFHHSHPGFAPSELYSLLGRAHFAVQRAGPGALCADAEAGRHARRPTP